MTRSIGKMVGLLLTLYVFNEIIITIYTAANLNNSSMPFYTAATFVYGLLPVVGILAAFEIIYSALKASGLA